MVYRIQARYGELRQVADRFNHQGDVICDLEKLIRSKVENLECSNWTGRGADAFFEEMYREVLPGLRRLHMSMEGASQGTLKIMTTYQNAEQEAAALFGGKGPAQGDIIAQVTGDFLQGVRNLFHTGMDIVADIAGAGMHLIQVSDQAITGFLYNFLNPDGASASKKLFTIKLEKEIILPAGLVDLPFSVKGVQIQEASLSFDPKTGLFALKLTGEGAGGIYEDLTPGAELHVGESVKSPKFDASAEGLIKTGGEFTFTFDPRKPGEMTKMATFATAVGASAVLGNLGGPFTSDLMVSPTMAAMQANLTDFKVNLDSDAAVKLGGSASFLAGFEGKGDFGSQGSLEWHSANPNITEFHSGYELSGEVKANFLTSGGGVNGSVKLDNILRSDGTSASVLEVTVRADQNGQFNFGKLLPEGAILDKIKPTSGVYNEVKIAYTLNQPYESVAGAIRSGDIHQIVDHAGIVVTGTNGDQTKFAVGGSVTIPSQTIKGEASVQVGRSSEEIIYEYTHKAAAGYRSGAGGGGGW
jgi:WXG100 family type VII secretion target